MDPIFADGAAKLRSRAAPSARIEPQILFLTEQKEPTQRLDESYSVKAEEKRQQREEDQKSSKPKPHCSHGDQQASERRGGRPSHEKIDQANVHELILPEGFIREQRHRSPGRGERN